MLPIGVIAGMLTVLVAGLVVLAIAYYDYKKRNHH